MTIHKDYDRQAVLHIAPGVNSTFDWHCPHGLQTKHFFLFVETPWVALITWLAAYALAGQLIRG